MVKGRFFRAYVNKCRKMGAKVLTSPSTYDPCSNCLWPLLPSFHDSHQKMEKENTSSEEKTVMIPRDVPKGHLVVYVGEECKRFVIKVSVLKHPMFKALLDRAREEYEFTPHSAKLCIPCEEKVFLTVLRCASTPANQQRIILCL